MIRIRGGQRHDDPGFYHFGIQVFDGKGGLALVKQDDAVRGVDSPAERDEARSLSGGCFGQEGLDQRRIIVAGKDRVHDRAEPRDPPTRVTRRNCDAQRDVGR